MHVIRFCCVGDGGGDGGGGSCGGCSSEVETLFGLLKQMGIILDFI